MFDVEALLHVDTTFKLKAQHEALKRIHLLFDHQDILPQRQPTTPPNVPTQNNLGDCWLLAPLAALAARRPDRLKRLFDATTSADLAAGRATLRLYRHGEWTPVTVDTLLPCDPSSGAPLYCSSAGWAALVEKAYAKLLGSYAALDGGRSEEALVELTGGLCERRSLKANAGKPSLKPSELATLVQRWLADGHLVLGIRTLPKAVVAANAAASSASAPSELHAVAVLAVERRDETMLTVRDTAQAEPGSLSAELGTDREVSVAVFCQKYDRLLVCYLHPEAPTPPQQRSLPYLQHTIRLPEPRGGPSSSPLWCVNPQVGLRVEKECEVTASLAQRAGTRRGEAPLPLSLSALRADATEAGGARCALCHDDARLVGSAGPAAVRELSLRFVARAGARYLLVPSTTTAETALAEVEPEAASAAVAAAAAQGGEELVLRIWCAATCRAQRVAPPKSVAHDGAWRGDSAGGRFPAPTWGANPQLAVCSPSGGDVHLVLQSAFSTAAAANPDEAAIGMRVLTAPRRPPPHERDDSEGDGPRALAISGMCAGVDDDSAPVLLHPALEVALGRGGLGGESEIGAYIRSAAGKSVAAAAKPRVATAAAAASETAVEDTHRTLARCRQACHEVERALRSPDEGLIAEAGYTSAREARAQIRLAPASPVLVVPSTASPHVWAPFRLLAFSRGPLEVHPLADGCCKTCEGGWRNGRLLATSASAEYVPGVGPTVRQTFSVSSAGGSRVEPGWAANPQLAAWRTDTVGGPWTLRITLSRPGERWAPILRRRPADAMFGFSVLAADDAEGVPTRRLAQPRDAETLHETPFSASCEQSCVLRLREEITAVVVVPSTFAAGVEGGFALTLVSESAFDMAELDA